MKRITTLIFILQLLLPLSFLSAQGLKIGWVDSQKIFEGLPEAQDAKKKLDVQVKGWQEELEKASKDFQAQYEDYQAKQATMTEAAKQAKQQELLKVQTQIQDFRTQKFGSDGEAVREQKKIFQPLQEKVLKAIGELAKEEKLNFVFDKLPEAAILLYAEEKFDYTFKILDRLKRGVK